MADADFVVMVPMINVNDQDAVVAGVFIRPGSPIKVGDLICSLEATKATFDVEAETSGPGRDGGKERCYPLTGGAEERDRSYLFLVKRKPFPCFSISTVESIWNGTSQIFHNRFSIKLDKRVRIGLTLPTA